MAKRSIDQLLRPVRRWVVSRKMEIVLAYKAGHVTLEQLQRAHGISSNELNLWCNYFDKLGHKALRATRGQDSQRSMMKEAA